MKHKNQNQCTTALVTSTPNFDKPAQEGLNERIFSVKMLHLRRLNERLTVAGEVEIPLHQVQNSVGRLGHETMFAEARVSSTVDSSGRIQTSIEDATGLQFTGSVDFVHDDYKFGFGFDMAASRKTHGDTVK